MNLRGLEVSEDKTKGRQNSWKLNVERSLGNKKAEERGLLQTEL